MIRTAVYVDGFNLYYRALKGSAYKWLDPIALARQLLRKDTEIVAVKYFTARVQPHAGDPTIHVRQDTYIRALQAHIPILTVHEGTFTRHAVPMTLVTRIPNVPRRVEVWKNEEKGSDVNLATHLLNDAWLNVFDSALVVSNDSDLAEAVLLTRQRSKAVGIACPELSPGQPSYELSQVASFVRRIEVKHLRRAQMPNPVAGSITKPPGW